MPKKGKSVAVAHQTVAASQTKALRLKAQVEREVAMDVPVDGDKLIEQLQRVGSSIKTAFKIRLEATKAQGRLVARIRRTAPPPAAVPPAPATKPRQ